MLCCGCYDTCIVFVVQLLLPSFCDGAARLCWCGLTLILIFFAMICVVLLWCGVVFGGGVVCVVVCCVVLVFVMYCCVSFHFIS